MQGEMIAVPKALHHDLNNPNYKKSESLIVWNGLGNTRLVTENISLNHLATLPNTKTLAIKFRRIVFWLWVN